MLTVSNTHAAPAETTIPQTETAFALTYLKRERNIPDVLPGLIQEMSNNQLLVPENSITMQNMVGEGEEYYDH